MIQGLVLPIMRGSFWSVDLNDGGGQGWTPCPQKLPYHLVLFVRQQGRGGAIHGPFMTGHGRGFVSQYSSNEYLVTKNYVFYQYQYCYVKKAVIVSVSEIYQNKLPKSFNFGDQFVPQNLYMAENLVIVK